MVLLKKLLRNFLPLIKSQPIKTLVDVRLNNVSQLAGFAKKKDLEFFLSRTLGRLRPCSRPRTNQRDADPHKSESLWEIYEDNFLNLMAKGILGCIDKSLPRRLLVICSEQCPITVIAVL